MSRAGRNDQAVRPSDRRDFATADGDQLQTTASPSPPGDLFVLSVSVGLVNFPAASLSSPEGDGNESGAPSEVNLGILEEIGSASSETSRASLHWGSTRPDRHAPIPNVPGVGSARVPSFRGVRTESVKREPGIPEIPPPLGAELISEFAPFDREAIEQAISRLRDRLERLVGPFREGGDDHQYLFPVIATIVALEVARRWCRRRRFSGSTCTWKMPGSMLRCLF
jgi:hypothetical protein